MFHDCVCVAPGNSSYCCWLSAGSFRTRATGRLSIWRHLRDAPDVALEGLGREAIEPRMGVDALVLGGVSPIDPTWIRRYAQRTYGGDR